MRNLNSTDDTIYIHEYDVPGHSKYLLVRMSIDEMERRLKEAKRVSKSTAYLYFDLE